MAKKGSNMSNKAAARIQSHADRSGKNARFKSRAQSAAAKSTTGNGAGSGKAKK